MFALEIDSFRGPKPRHDFECLIRALAATFGTRERIETGEFRAVIDRRYPLDEIVEPYRYVETGEKVGNVVIDVVQI